MTVDSASTAQLRGRLLADRAWGILARVGVWVFLALALAMAATLLYRSVPVLREHGAATILGSEWRPQQGLFGLRAFVFGTLLLTGLAMLAAAPVAILGAIFIVEYAPRPLARVLRPCMDLLGGLPSVLLGVWGVLLVVPAVARIAEARGLWSSGYCLLSAALVLALMVSPAMIQIGCEVLDTVPRGLRDASLSLGATRWQTIRHAVLRQARPGLLASVLLAASRAMGETIAVLMVVGNVPAIPRSLFDPAYPIPALLANNYGEMMSIPLYDSAMMLSALVLLAAVVLLNLAGRLALRWSGRHA